VQVELARPEQFLRKAGPPQDRYELLRVQWLAPEGGGVFGLMRSCWARRLLHFGLLGLLDEDPTGDGWFGTGTSAVAGPRCTRVLLAAEDGQVRAAAAYRFLLQPCPPGSLQALEEAG
jgi:hypothetical protein